VNFDWINVGIFAASAVAAAVAVWQAAGARRSSIAAAATADGAKRALEQSAKALNEANEIARSKLLLSPWEFSNHNGTVTLRNASSIVLRTVTVDPGGWGRPDSTSAHAEGNASAEDQVRRDSGV
jgi:hypothetical protein